MTASFDLADLGWTPFFAAQVLPHETSLLPARVTAVRRDRLHVCAPAVAAQVAPFQEQAGDAESAATIGDWLLLTPDGLAPRRLLRRASLFKRRAAGTGRQVQLIAANVDTLFIVSSCNREFNPARLERYLALARQAQTTPVVVLTKADLTDNPQDFARAAARLLSGLLVETLDAREPGDVARLAPWCGRGATVALVGSSGVGKSTLVNTLTCANILTGPVREDDDRGRHTTTARELHRLPSGGWLLDTPGMRELQLLEVGDGLADVFADVLELARDCRFGDCRHETEPGCAVRAALASGELDADRVARWRKLVAEDARNTESIAERRARERAFGRLAKRTLEDKRSRRDG